jgi:hypothetical protein
MNDDRQLKRRVDWRNLAFLYARATLGITFLSGIADRFGLWHGRNGGYGNFAGFVHYTAQVNSFMPASSVPCLGCHHRRVSARHLPPDRFVAALDGFSQCPSADTFWNCHGHLVWSQVAIGLLGFFSFRGSSFACTQ